MTSSSSSKRKVTMFGWVGEGMAGGLLDGSRGGGGVDGLQLLLVAFVALALLKKSQASCMLVKFTAIATTLLEGELGGGRGSAARVEPTNSNSALPGPKVNVHAKTETNENADVCIREEGI